MNFAGKQQRTSIQDSLKYGVCTCRGTSRKLQQHKTGRSYEASRFTCHTHKSTKSIFLLTVQKALGVLCVALSTWAVMTRTIYYIRTI